MTTRGENILERGSRLKKLLAASATALVLGAAMATPSWAAVGPGKSIEVFHGIEYVGLHGYPATTSVQVEVVRNDVVIGNKTMQTDADGFLEINHVGGNDCWEPPVTPDILPGDVLRTTYTDSNGQAVVDTSAVRDVFLDQDPVVDRDANTITVTGSVRDLPGAPLDKAADTLEIRLNSTGTWDNGRKDLRENVSLADFEADGDGNADTFRHVFQVSDREADLAAGGGIAEKAIEWSAGAAGEEEVIPEITVFDGADLEIADCPPRVSYAVTDSNLQRINAANVGQNLIISGSSADASSVRVEVTDGTNTLTRTATPSPAGGGQSWSATFEGGVGSLADGRLTARAFYTVDGGEIGGVNLEIAKDVAPPAIGAANLADSSDTGELNNDDLTNDSTPTLNGTAEAGSKVRLFDGTTLLGETTASAGGSWEFTVPADKALGNGQHAIKASATDAFDNSAESGVLNVNVDTQVAVVNASPQGGTYGTAQNVTLSLADAAQEEGTKIYFTRDGSTPQPIAGQLYTGPINIAQNTTLKYRALDRAGNISDAGTQNYQFDFAGPRLSGRSPAVNATGVALGANVRATFNENVTGVSGATFRLRQGTRFVPAVVTYDASTRTATLNPNANLARGTRYTVVLTSGIKDGVGNSLAATNWSFTTR